MGGADRLNSSRTTWARPRFNWATRTCPSSASCLQLKFRTRTRWFGERNEAIMVAWTIRMLLLVCGHVPRPPSIEQSCCVCSSFDAGLNSFVTAVSCVYHDLSFLRTCTYLG